MNANTDILEIPIFKTKDVGDLVKWFEKEKVYEKKHPTISFEQDNFPTIVMIGFFVIIGMALMVLEEKGKWKVKPSDSDGSVDNFKEKLIKSKTESSIERLIEKRYNINLLIVPHHSSIVKEPSAKYGLNDVFGIWKNKKVNLDKVREEQWGRRK